MLDEGNTPNLMETPDAPPPEEKSNRTFWIVGGIMAGLVFLTLVCMAVYFLVIAPAHCCPKKLLPRQRSKQGMPRPSSR